MINKIVKFERCLAGSFKLTEHVSTTEQANIYAKTVIELLLFSGDINQAQKMFLPGIIKGLRTKKFEKKYKASNFSNIISINEILDELSQVSEEVMLILTQTS